MKTTLIFLFLAIPYLCFSQIPKKANTIIIVGKSTQEEYFNQINSKLLENGYGIINSDLKTGTITTQEKPLKRCSTKFVILAQNQKILVRGQFNVNLTADLVGPDWMEIRYYGMNNSPSMDAWKEMVKIADAIPGEKQYIMK